ncbi:MAG: response regulator transcription factor [Pseudobutyrivibrio sp.]|uniref:LytR/AlgR family response regulator transcription factor n=1 Tax=Pseudobutyrivibrio sp. TaxID=2014367 RepID=UPI001B02E1E5|nr:LytTR family DNA-binding domain-containing protein [Pseudobutyrivibrio sp.]MBO6284333.1 response regulator transcription factor [Pseudobutyrivibrio sp.]MBQ8488409.1 response regulator transcription factor [Pseudobutyrivibrio sp.]
MKIAIVEDEIQYVNQLENQIKKYAIDKGVEIDTTIFSDGMSFIENYKPIYDAILMDIEMPHLDGMAAASELRRVDEDVPLMFITNAPQYAISGYKVRAIDYVIKPVEYFAFAMKLDRIRQINEMNEDGFIIIKKNDEISKISLKTIKYVEVQKHDIFYHLVDKIITDKGSLKNIEGNFPTDKFAKCNSCYLVNLRYVEGIKDDCVVISDELLKISRPRKKDFMQKMVEYYKKGI